ncbi:MAG TPA: TolC family protein [Thermoanaerobaculia bacterium]|nr:TolC family protein [Thermoanaerobaculia bacterium]
MNSKLVSCGLVAAFLFFVPAARSETVRIGLNEAIDQAIRNSSNAELARSAEERARIASSEAFTALLPQGDAKLIRSSNSINLATFGFTLPGFPPVIGPFNVIDGQITAATQIFNLAALRHYQALRSLSNAGRYGVQQTENELAAAAGRLYVLVQRADAQVATREADVQLFTQLAKIANDEFQAGTGTKLDVAQANVQLTRAKSALLSAQNDRQSAQIALLNAIGANQSSDLVLTDALTAPAPPATDAAIAAAKEKRPELKQLAEQEKAAELAVRAARSRYIPSLALDFTGDYAGNTTSDMHSSRTIAAVASVPLFHTEIRANIERAKLELRDAQTRRSHAESDIEQQVRTSILQMQNAEARVAVSEENVKVAEEALQIARDRKSAGYGSPVEVDRAEDTYRQAHEDLIAARADAAAAWIEVQRATGALIPAVIPSGVEGPGGTGGAPTSPPGASISLGMTEPK